MKTDKKNVCLGPQRLLLIFWNNFLSVSMNQLKLNEANAHKAQMSP